MSKQSEPRYNSGSLEGDDQAERDIQRARATVAEPPPYSATTQDVISTTSLNLRTDAIPGLPTLPWSDYRPPGSTIESKELATVRMSSPSITTSVSDFVRFINQQASLPPKQAIRIVGQHQRYTVTETDFDFRLDLLRYFLPKEGSLALNYVRVPTKMSGGGQSLQDYAKTFLADVTRPKQ